MLATGYRLSTTTERPFAAVFAAGSQQSSNEPHKSDALRCS